VAVRRSAQADADLIDIYLQSATLFGPHQAEQYLDGLERAFQLIAEFPLAARLRTELVPPIRVHAHGAHVILYVVEEPDVYVLRIRHGGEDWAALDNPA
jgi:toxin ParE1/3/4